MLHLVVGNTALGVRVTLNGPVARSAESPCDPLVGDSARQAAEIDGRILPVLLFPEWEGGPDEGVAFGERVATRARTTPVVVGTTSELLLHVVRRCVAEGVLPAAEVELLAARDVIPVRLSLGADPPSWLFGHLERELRRLDVAASTGRVS